MEKLSPPLIEGTIPAFYSENGTAKIVVPFSMNRAVSKVQVDGIAIKIKTIQSSSYLYEAAETRQFYYNLEDSPWVEFTNIPVDKFRVGQFYKVQIAYIKKGGTGSTEKYQEVMKEMNDALAKIQQDYLDGVYNSEEEYQQVIQNTKDYYSPKITEYSNFDIGYYSTAAVIKYTSKPDLYIYDVEQGPINSHSYEYKGIYHQSQDTSERVYSYRFDVYDPNDNLILTSGNMIHNHADDTELDESYDTYLFSQDLEVGAIYKIQYTVTTNNLLTLSTPRYRIMQKPSIDPEIKASLNVALNYDNGYIKVNLIGEKLDGMEEPVTGAFLLTRACEDTGYAVWEEVSRFKLAGQIPSRQLWRDFTVEQGKHYQYSLQQYNDNGLYSNRMLSNIIYADFEDAFLFDGERQLKIKYNPKVSSIKKDLLETKTDTIGGKHPFIFRNGRVYYTEFPISGLVSYQMDEENLFLSEADYLLSEKTTNLVSENIASERIFKMKVLEWLTNGKTKVFRSPGEGNYIVRLMNTSMSPNDTLGRMLHTFTSTAYEVAEFNYENLNEMNFISLKDPEVPTLRWETANFYAVAADGTRMLKTQINDYVVETARFNDLMPGDTIKLTFENGDEQVIQIGVTGSYYIDTGMAIRKIEPGDNFSSYNASMTYSYYSTQSNVFDKIADVEVNEVSTHQFIGEQDLIKEIEYVLVEDEQSHLKNPKVDILDIYGLTFRKRQVEKLIKSGDKYYTDANLEDEFDVAAADPFTLYAIGTWEKTISGSEGDGYRPGYAALEFVISGYMDFYNNKYYEGVDSYNAKAQINNQLIGIDELEIYNLSKPGKLNIIEIGNGVVAEMSYQVRTIDYRIEHDSTYGNLVEARTNYDNTIAIMKKWHLDIATSDSSIVDYNKFIEYQTNIQTTYRTLILELIKAQEEEKKAEGLT